MLTCPVCHAPLALEGRTYRCRSGHAFDRAREGYVDLLPVGHGRSGIAGDTRAMARARARFHATGAYDPLLRAITAAVEAHLRDHEGDRGNPVVAEAGCGVGTYIGGVADAIPAARAFGFDVSREPLRMAARTYPRATFAVNDTTHRICLADASADVLLDVFAPRNAAEFARVLREGGLLVVVIPGERHLHQLRERLGLLGIEPEKRQRTLAQLAPAFLPIGEEALEWEAELSAAAVADLAAMGPSAFHADAAPPRDGAAARVTLSFRLLRLRARRRGGATAESPRSPSPAKS